MMTFIDRRTAALVFLTGGIILFDSVQVNGVHLKHYVLKDPQVSLLRSKTY